MSSSDKSQRAWWKDAALAVGCLVLVLVTVFHQSLDPDQVVFANDAPLGAIQAHANDENQGWAFWQDLNWVGGEFPAAMPNFTQGFFSLCMLLDAEHGAVQFAKWYPPAALLLLGFSGWLFFRSLQFSAPVSLLGGLALALNGDLFSYTSWGLPSVALGAAGALLAMAGVVQGIRETGWRRVAWVVLGGLALGQGVMESFDVGGIFSLYVAVFVLMAAANHALADREQWPRSVASGAGILALVVLASVLMAWHTLDSLRRTEGGAAMKVREAAAGAEVQVAEVHRQIDRVIGQIQSAPNISEAEKQQQLHRFRMFKQFFAEDIRNQHFDFVTQWSVPPRESLRMLVPGLYGYRDNPHGWMPLEVDAEQRYWGRVGQTPSFVRIQEEFPKFHEALSYFEEMKGRNTLFPRHASSGIYMGLMVLVLALWAVLQACRGEGGAYQATERRWIFFWAALAVLSLVLAWGHHAPFYKLIYQLPFFNVIRNPIKFMHPCAMAMVILFAYGLHGLAREYLVERKRAKDGVEQFKQWLQGLRGWDRNWAWGMLVATGLSVLVWGFYAAIQTDLKDDLVSGAGFNAEVAGAMATGSLKSFGLAVVFLWITLLVLAIFMAGVFPVRFAVLNWGMLGLVLCVDLVIGSRPHLVHYNWRNKYAANDVVEYLARRPYEQRVAHATELVQLENQQLATMAQTQTNAQMQAAIGLIQAQNVQFHQVYQTDWKQAMFPYHRIHALDIIQEPRPDPRNSEFRQAMKAAGGPYRMWQLTSTRYLLGNSFQFARQLGELSGLTNQFTVLKRFDLIQHPMATNSLTAAFSTNGNLALVSFDAALPRAGLYTRWQSGLDDADTLKKLVDPTWEPRKEVLVSEAISPPVSTDLNGTVWPVRHEFYDAKRVVLATEADVPTVLLLNDKHHAGWQVTVNGRPAPLLRANYLMRGVQLPAGKHQVEFRFAPDERSVTISLAGFGLGLLALGLLVWLPKPSTDEDANQEEVIDLPPIDDQPDGSVEPKEEDSSTTPSDDPETSTVDDTSSPDEPKVPSRRKSRSRSGRRNKR